MSSRPPCDGGAGFRTAPRAQRMGEAVRRTLMQWGSLWPLEP